MTEQHAQTLRTGLRHLDLADERVLLIVPDTTRTVPMAWFFHEMWAELHDLVAALDVMVALGTHQPMDEQAVNTHLGLSAADRNSTYRNLTVYNHAWNDPAELIRLGTIPARDIRRLSEGHIDEDLVVSVNRHALEYDRLLILSPVFPHELVGFSGGFKYLFPGISGPEIIDLTHWLAALTGNLRTIGRLNTPFREVIDAAAALVPVQTSAVCTVIKEGDVDAVFVGEVTDAWAHAARHSERVHTIRKPHPFHHVLARAPLMYEDLWTGAKPIYKCEPVVAAGGELIVYAPHITSLSLTHGNHLERCGYHCIEYFLHHADRFADVPRMIIGVASYIYGAGTYDGRTERPRMYVKLATGIPEETCRRVGLGYVDPATINFEEWKDRENEGILYVEKAGETLYRLEDAKNAER